MNTGLLALSVLAGLLALVRSVLERRAPGRIPLADLIRAQYGRPSRPALLGGALLGTAVVLGPAGAAAALGWARFQPAGALTRESAVGMGATGVIIVTWALLEELIFRGAVLPQAARLTNGWLGLAASALLFSWGHLGRGGARAPDGLSLLVFGLDGIGFGLAYLAGRSLWLPAVWHAVKNLWVWLLFSAGTLQLVPGLFQAEYTGPGLWIGAAGQAGLLDVLAAALAMLSVAVIGRRPIVAGLAWVQRPPADQ